jgi:hypothetical protein
MSEYNSTREQRYRERYIRWQRFSIEQLGFVNNILIGLAAGIIVFQLKIAFDSDLSTLSILSKHLLFISQGLMALSLLSGSLLAWNRLRDFRLTRRKILRQWKQMPDEKKRLYKVKELKKVIKRLGKVTWVFFNIQIITFLLGGTAIVASSICQIMTVNTSQLP